MDNKDLIKILAEKFLQGEGTISELSKKYKVRGKLISDELRSQGYFVSGGASLSSIIGIHDAIEEYIKSDKTISLTKLADKYEVKRQSISSRLKAMGIEVVNNQNKVKFNENIFDSVDTEEKAYWLGFIYADGYIKYNEEGEKPSYIFELSLSVEDVEHLRKFNLFMGHIKDNVKIGNSKCEGKIFKRCRWGIANKHLWNILNNYGCTPRKSLTLKFPDESIFIESNKYSKEELIKHFIRGYWDGDGCLSWCDKDHKQPHVSVLGTEDFLTEIKSHLPLKYDYVLGYNNKSEITRALSLHGRNGYELADYLYKNATIYLDRKYNKYLEYCRLYEESCRELQTNNGEGCDVNPVISTETKESVPLYRVETEPSSEE